MNRAPSEKRRMNGWRRPQQTIHTSICGKHPWGSRVAIITTWQICCITTCIKPKYLYKTWRPKVFFSNVLVTSFCLIWIPTLLVYGHCKCFTLSVRRSTLDVRARRLQTSDFDVYRCRNLTSIDSRIWFWRLKLFPAAALQGSSSDRRGANQVNILGDHWNTPPPPAHITFS